MATSISKCGVRVYMNASTINCHCYFHISLLAAHVNIPTSRICNPGVIILHQNITNKQCVLHCCTRVSIYENGYHVQSCIWFEKNECIGLVVLRWHWVANNNTYGNVLVSYESNAVEHHSSSHVSSCRNATITALDSMFLGTSLFAPVESILKQKWWCWWWWWCCWFVA